MTGTLKLSVWKTLALNYGFVPVWSLQGDSCTVSVKVSKTAIVFYSGFLAVQYDKPTVVCEDDDLWLLNHAYIVLDP